MTEILSPYDTRLNQISEPVDRDEIKSRAIQNLMATMLTIAGGERDINKPQRPTMVGLAAPQIGVFKRVILIDMAADPGVPNFEPQLELFINPEIVEASKHFVLGREGCYSTGEICGAVHRPDEVYIKALTPDGSEIEIRSRNAFQARIIQHEIDHLNGIRFPQHITDPTKLHLVAKEKFGDYRTEWPHWKIVCPPETWRKMHKGIEAV